MENIEEEKSKKRKKTKKKNPEINELLKNVSIPKGIELESVDINKAKFLCSLPKSLGVNPENQKEITLNTCLLYTSPSPRDLSTSRMPSSA